ncbi:MAG: hypothetical protein ACJ8DI_31480 [Ktedonobacteraceae bacterium]
MSNVTYECYKCKAINYFDPDPNVQLLVERKGLDRTIKADPKEPLKSLEVGLH